MNNLAIVMLKNEMEILREFCAHILALFEHAILIDHRSTDGSQQFIRRLEAKHKGVEAYVFNNPGYYQSELMTWMVQEKVMSRNPDWVFLLDCDEFLPFKSRREFEQALSKFEHYPVIELPWINLVPLEALTSRMIGKRYLAPPTHACHSKVAFQPALIPVNPFYIGQGNHKLLFTRNGEQTIPSHSAFSIYHIPLRSKAQLERKIEQGVEAYKKLGADRRPDQGTHWDDISKIVAKQGVTPELIGGLIDRYGRSMKPPYERSLSNLRAEGYTDLTLDVACEQLPAGLRRNSPKLHQEPLIHTHNSRVHSSTTTRKFMNLHLKAETGVIDFREEEAKTIPERLRTTLTLRPKNEFEFFLSFIHSALTPIETLVPTAWGGHIPFMISLVKLLEPRVFVELGSHHGASFFAACQSIRDNDIACKAHAVDRWKGDHQAGFYGEDVYQRFVWLLNERYPGIGEPIQTSFDEAASRFDRGSIDLLHIDGLHTYEAVKNDYQTWIDKVSADGVVLFHDTHVREGDFGVWKLWDEIRHDYIHFSFSHTHGLGIIAKGSKSSSSIVRLLNYVNSSEFNREFFDKFFEAAGSLSTSQAFSAIKLKEASKELERMSAEKVYSMEKLYRRAKKRLGRTRSKYNAVRHKWLRLLGPSQ